MSNPNIPIDPIDSTLKNLNNTLEILQLKDTQSKLAQICQHLDSFFEFFKALKDSEIFSIYNQSSSQFDYVQLQTQNKKWFQGSTLTEPLFLLWKTLSNCIESIENPENPDSPFFPIVSDVFPRLTLNYIATICKELKDCQTANTIPLVIPSNSNFLPHIMLLKTLGFVLEAIIEKHSNIPQSKIFSVVESICAPWKAQFTLHFTKSFSKVRRADRTWVIDASLSWLEKVNSHPYFPQKIQEIALQICIPTILKLFSTQLTTLENSIHQDESPILKSLYLSVVFHSAQSILSSPYSMSVKKQIFSPVISTSLWFPLYSQSIDHHAKNLSYFSKSGISIEECGVEAHKWIHLFSTAFSIVQLLPSATENARLNSNIFIEKCILGTIHSLCNTLVDSSDSSQNINKLTKSQNPSWILLKQCQFAFLFHVEKHIVLILKRILSNQSSSSSSYHLLFKLPRVITKKLRSHCSIVLLKIFKSVHMTQLINNWSNQIIDPQMKSIFNSASTAHSQTTLDPTVFTITPSLGKAFKLISSLFRPLIHFSPQLLANEILCHFLTNFLPAVADWSQYLDFSGQNQFLSFNSFNKPIVYHTNLLTFQYSDHQSLVLYLHTAYFCSLFPKEYRYISVFLERVLFYFASASFSLTETQQIQLLNHLDLNTIIPLEFSKILLFHKKKGM